MWSRLAIIAGLLAGIVVAVLLLGGIYVLAPEPIATISPTPVPTIVVTPAPSVAPSAEPSAEPSGPGPSPSEFIGGDEAHSRGAPGTEGGPLVSVPGTGVVLAAAP